MQLPFTGHQCPIILPRNRLHWMTMKQAVLGKRERQNKGKGRTIIKCKQAPHTSPHPVNQTMHSGRSAVPAHEMQTPKFYFVEGRERRVAIPAGYFVSQYQLSTVLKGPWVPQAQLGVACSNWVDLQRVKQQPDTQVFAGMLVANREGLKSTVWLPGEEEEWGLQSSSQLQDVPVAWESTPKAAHPTHTTQEQSTLPWHWYPCFPNTPLAKRKHGNNSVGRMVILQIVYRGQSQNAGGSHIIRSHGRDAQQQWCNPALGCESTGKHCTGMAHRAGCQHACLPHIPPHSHFSDTSLHYNTHHTYYTHPSSPHPIIISPTPRSFEAYLRFSPCSAYSSTCITSHLSDGFSVLRNFL